MAVRALTCWFEVHSNRRDEDARRVPKGLVKEIKTNYNGPISFSYSRAPPSIDALFDVNATSKKMGKAGRLSEGAEAPAVTEHQ